MLCSRRFPAPSQNLTSSIIPLLILICNFFFSSIHTQIQNDRRRGAKENKGTQFVISPRLPLPDSKQTQMFFCKCCSFIARHPSRDCFWSWSQIYCLWCLRCSPAVTGPQCLHSGYYFWLSPLHLGAQRSLFHFLCHNAMAKKKKKIPARHHTIGNANNICCVSDSPFFPLYSAGADDQWVCQRLGLKTKGQGSGKRRVFRKHVTLTIIHLQSVEQNNMNPPYQNPEEEP